MKKENKLVILIFIGFLAFLGLKSPLSTLLTRLDIDPTNAGFISGITIRGILILLIITIVIKLDFKNFIGVGQKKIHNSQALIIALSIIGIGIKTNWSTYQSVETTSLYLFFTSVMFVGFLEEFVFRGTIFPLFIRSLKNKKNTLLLSAILSSLLFGLIHYINLFSNPNNFIGISSQVFLAFAIGVFFAGLMLRTENIIIPAILHGLINFAFGAGDLSSSVSNSTAEINQNGINWSSIIPTFIIFCFILGGGIYMINKTNQEEIFRKLGVQKSTAGNNI